MSSFGIAVWAGPRNFSKAPFLRYLPPTQILNQLNETWWDWALEFLTALQGMLGHAQVVWKPYFETVHMYTTVSIIKDLCFYIGNVESPNLPLSLPILNNLSINCMCAWCMYACVLPHTCEGQSTTLWRWFSTLYVAYKEQSPVSRLSCWASLSAEPSHQHPPIIFMWDFWLKLSTRPN